MVGRSARDRARVVVGLALFVGAIVCTVWAYQLPMAERSTALLVPGFVLAMAGFLVNAIPLVVSLGRRPPARPVDALATLLAEAVDGQWRQAAIERRLLTPTPIPIRWSLSDLSVAAFPVTAVGAPGEKPAFPPLPYRTRIIEPDLEAGGGRAELHQVYAGLASGRVIVVGAPGAGKTGTAILLLLDALAHRDDLDDNERARVPVPVLLTPQGWDPTTCSVRDWLRDQLTAMYPLFAHRGGRDEAAALVAARDRIALILDGLDEMDETLRPAALQALGDAPFRVVVLTRNQELRQAASVTWLAGAVAVHLHDVTALDAVDYLKRARVGPSPTGWADLLDHLNDHPDGILARGLSTPLTLTLFHDTYRTGDNVRALLDRTRFPTTDTIAQHLIARVLPAAYTPIPGRPPPRYTEQQARQTLSFIARQMGKRRDFAWWHIPRWAPVTPRILATLVAAVLVGEFVGGLMGWLTGWLVDSLLVGLIGGLAGGFIGARSVGHVTNEPRRVRTWNLRVTLRSLPHVLEGGGMLGFIVGFVGWLRVGQTVGLRVGLIAGVMFMLAAVVGVGLTERSSGRGIPVGPRRAWRDDQMSGLVDGLVGGLGLGPTVGLVVGLTFGLRSGSIGALAFGLTSGLTFTLVSGLIHRASWATALAWLQLQTRRRVSAVSLIPFLEDARERGILRTVGAIYQFRHARLLGVK